MAFSASLSHVVLVITAAVLFYVALTDLKHFKIRNEVILVLTGLFVVHAILSGRWVSAHWNLAFAALDNQAGKPPLRRRDCSQALFGSVGANNRMSTCY